VFTPRSPRDDDIWQDAVKLASAAGGRRLDVAMAELSLDANPDPDC